MAETVQRESYSMGPHSFGEDNDILCSAAEIIRGKYWTLSARGVAIAAKEAAILCSLSLLCNGSDLDRKQYVTLWVSG